jgi:1-phosphofructokinase
MIITVTLNPALDKTAELDELRPGELNRLQNLVVDAGGKGINVSKMISALGGRSVATGFVGGGSGKEIVDTLAAMDIQSDFIKVNGTTRTNLKVLDHGRRLTELNEPGVMVSEADVERLVKKLSGYAGPDTVFVLSGSLCRGVEPDFYARLIRIIHQGGGMACLDADGAAFRSALEEKPEFIKPNGHELTEYFGLEKKPGLGEFRELCARLVALGISRIALSLGKDGAMFVNGKDVCHAPGLSVEAHSAVGAGDSMMGVFAYAMDRQMPWRQAAALSIAASAGAVITIGTKAPEKFLVDRLLAQVQIEEI